MAITILQNFHEQYEAIILISCFAFNWKLNFFLRVPMF
jgi:hypothetical protein